MVAESFLPHLSGVTTSVLRSADHLRRAGHQVVFLAPSGRNVVPSEWSARRVAVGDAAEPGAFWSLLPGQAFERVEGVPTVRLPSVPLAGYPGLRISVGSVGAVRHVMAEVRPDVVHVASPFLLGARAVAAAASLGLPRVVVYQTDVAGYASRYGVPWLRRAADRRVAEIHGRATTNLAPSQASAEYLESLGVPRIRRWGRGVDGELFTPRRRTGALRRRLGLSEHELLVGFVGRLASEKRVEDLRVLQSLDGVRLVVVGDGPERVRLEQTLHRACFTGTLRGTELAGHVADMDVFVHPGEFETFGQTIQEAMASGVATVAVGAGGPLDIIRDGVDGRLYAPGQLGQLREIVAGLRDAAERTRLGSAATAAMRPRTWAGNTERLAEHYQEAIRLHEAGVGAHSASRHRVR